jgi:hypothetical protein
MLAGLAAGWLSCRDAFTACGEAVGWAGVSFRVLTYQQVTEGDQMRHVGTAGEGRTGLRLGR